MTKTYQIKINQGKDSKPLDIPQAGAKGQAVTVKAVSGARYQLIDPETGYGPENIRASRQGKDLKVSFEGSKTTDLVIEDYYTASAENFNGLIGEAESGKFYEYIPENAAGMASVPMLADAGQVVGMALGGAEVAPAGAAVGVLAAGLFSPWLLGAGALGVAAAAGGGGGGAAATTDTTAPTGQTGALAQVSTSDSGKLGDNLTGVTKPVITGKAEAGSTVEVSFRDPAGKLTGPYKTTADANGNYSLQVPTSLVDASTDTKGTQYTPVIKATDAAGNSSTADGTPFVVDTQVPTVGVQIDADANPAGNNDGYINAAEKGSGSTSVTVFLDKTKMVAGDVITLTDGTTSRPVTLTAEHIQAGQVVTENWALPTVEGQELKVKVTVKDLAGNVSSETSDSATVDTQAPNNNKALGLKVVLDGNDDGVIKSTEQKDAQSTDLTATFEKAVAGDKVIFSDGFNSKEVTLTASDITNGWVTTTGWGLPTQGKPTTFSAVLADPVGNTTPLVQKTVSIDPASSPSTKTALILDGITVDNLINLTEQANGETVIAGTVSGTFKENDNVILTLNGKTYTAQAAASGKFSVKVSTTDLIADSDTRIDAKVSGTNGELATAMQDYQVETSSNAGKLTALSIDAITPDNLINHSESLTSSIALAGTVTGRFQKGDTVTLLVNGVERTGTIDEAGKYSVSLDTKLLLADADTTVDAFVTGTGGASAKAMQNYGVDIQAPELKALTIDLDTSNKDGLKKGGDGWINQTEMNASNGTSLTSLTATFDKTTVSVGDKITFKNLDDSTKIDVVVLDQTKIDQGFVTSEGWSLPSKKGQINVSAIIQDVAGNKSLELKDNASIDTVAMTFKTPELAVVVGTVFNSVTFKPDPLNGFLEKGSYTLHVGDKTFDWSIGQTTPGANKLSLADVVGQDTPLQVLGSKIFLECWDEAGNHSISGLPTPHDGTTWNLGADTQFIV